MKTKVAKMINLLTGLPYKVTWPDKSSGLTTLQNIFKNVLLTFPHNRIKEMKISSFFNARLTFLTSSFTDEANAVKTVLSANEVKTHLFQVKTDEVNIDLVKQWI